MVGRLVCQCYREPRCSEHAVGLLQVQPKMSLWDTGEFLLLPHLGCDWCRTWLPVVSEWKGFLEELEAKEQSTPDSIVLKMGTHLEDMAKNGSVKKATCPQ